MAIKGAVTANNWNTNVKSSLKNNQTERSVAPKNSKLDESIQV